MAITTMPVPKDNYFRIYILVLLVELYMQYVYKK